MASATMVQSLPGRCVDDLAVGHFPLHGIKRLMLVEDHGIVVPDGCGHQPDHVDRR
jgi:hypothetical protein